MWIVPIKRVPLAKALGMDSFISIPIRMQVISIPMGIETTLTLGSDHR